MPNIYQFDNYEQCFGVYRDKALYCVANSYVKPDPSSELYRNKIKQEFGHPKHNLRHDVLQRGICINQCMENFRKLGNRSSEYFVERFPTDYKVQIIIKDLKKTE